MTSRVQFIREAYGQTPEEFAKVLDIHREWLFMAENTLDSSDIPDHTLSIQKGEFYVLEQLC